MHAKTAVICWVTGAMLLLGSANATAQERSWSGFYGGLHLGTLSSPGAGVTDVGVPSGAGGTPTFTAAQVKALSGATSGDTARIGGAQLGYNWRLSSLLVGGIEADMSAATQNTGTFGNRVFDAGNGVFVVSNFTTKAAIDYVGTVRGRIGYLLTPQLMLFATGGIAYAQVDTGTTFTTSYPATVVIANSGAFGGRSTRVGYTLGGGAEFAVTRNTSLKLEGLFYDLGTSSDTFTFRSFNTGGVLISTNTLTRHQDFSGALARLGFNIGF